MKKILTKSITMAVLACSFLASSCKTQSIEIAPNATNLEIVQQAQNAYDKGKKEQAIKCYEILIQRYGMDTAIYIEGRYEIAHIYLKQKKYDKAEPIFLEIKEIYDSTAPGMLPGAYRKMVMKDLEKIQDKKKK